jgi:hypothetical protein
MRTSLLLLETQTRLLFFVSKTGLVATFPAPSSQNSCMGAEVQAVFLDATLPLLWLQTQVKSKIGVLYFVYLSS